MSFKQAARLPADGGVATRRMGEHHISIEVINDGKEEAILVSEYNASRILGMLAMCLGVKISKADAENIRL